MTSSEIIKLWARWVVLILFLSLASTAMIWNYSISRIYAVSQKSATHYKILLFFNILLFIATLIFCIAAISAAWKFYQNIIQLMRIEEEIIEMKKHQAIANERMLSAVKSIVAPEYIEEKFQKNQKSKNKILPSGWI